MTTTRMTGAVLNLRKEAGLTSHDLVDLVRRVTGVRRVGHGGTLDPFAEGVLLVGLDSGAKILSYLSDLPKEYEAVLRLGESTETLDPETPVMERRPVPDLDREAVTAACARFVGTQEQEPPQYSALKIGGVRAYNLARQGLEVALAPRSITVSGMTLLGWDPPDVRFRALVSKGTYLRRLGSDLAASLGTCGHLVALTRTAVGPHRLERSVTMASLEEAGRGAWADLAMTMSQALVHLPRVVLDDEGLRMLRNGLWPEDHCAIPVPVEEGCLAAAVGPDGALAAVLRSGEYPTGGGRKPAPFRLERVLAG